MIIQKNRRARISNQNLIHFAIRCHGEKHLGTSIKYRRFQKKLNKKYVGRRFITSGILIFILVYLYIW